MPDTDRIEAIMDRESLKHAINMLVEIEASLKGLEGLMPLIRIKVDSDLAGLIDEGFTRILMALSAFNQHMKAYAPFRKVNAEHRKEHGDKPLEFVIAWMQGMSDEERKAFIDSIAETYCLHCGTKQPLHQRCQCNNDE